MPSDDVIRASSSPTRDLATRALTTRDPHERGRQHTSLARIVPAIHSTSASSQMLDDERRRHDRLPRPPPGARIVNNQPHTTRILIPPTAHTAGSHHNDIRIASTTTRSHLPHSRAIPKIVIIVTTVIIVIIVIIVTIVTTIITIQRSTDRTLAREGSVILTCQPSATCACEASR